MRPWLLFRRSSRHPKPAARRIRNERRLPSTCCSSATGLGRSVHRHDAGEDPLASRWRRNGGAHPQSRLGTDAARSRRGLATEPSHRSRSHAQRAPARLQLPGGRSWPRSTTTTASRSSAQGPRKAWAGPMPSSGRRSGAGSGPSSRRRWRARRSMSPINLSSPPAIPVSRPAGSPCPRYRCATRRGRWRASTSRQPRRPEGS